MSLADLALRLKVGTRISGGRVSYDEAELRAAVFRALADLGLSSERARKLTAPDFTSAWRALGAAHHPDKFELAGAAVRAEHAALWLAGQTAYDALKDSLLEVAALVRQPTTADELALRLKVGVRTRHGGVSFDQAELRVAVVRALSILDLSSDQGATLTTERLEAAWRRLEELHHPSRYPTAALQRERARWWAAAHEAHEALGGALDVVRALLKRGRGGDVTGKARLDATTWLRGGRHIVAVDAGTLGLRQVRLQVQPALELGQHWRVPGHGLPGDPPGDLLVELVEVVADERWSVDGREVRGRLALHYAAVYEGRRIAVETPWGKAHVTLRAGSFAPVRVRGHGVRRGGDSGDLLLELDVLLPEPGDAELLEVLQRLEDGVAS